MAAQGLPESAHSYYESLSSQAQQQPVSQSMYSLQHVQQQQQQQQQQQMLAPFESMTLQSTSSQGQEAFDSLTGHVQGPFSAQGLSGQPVQQGILEGLARQQRVASYNNLLAQAQAQAHAQVQAQVDHEQRLLDEYAVESAQRAHAAAGLMNSLHANPQHLAMDSASAQHNAALLASLHDVAQHRGTPGLDAGPQHGVLPPNGLQSRGSITLETLASQHSGQGSMLGAMPHPVPVRLASGISANGSMAALSELSEQQEPSLVSQDPLLDAARGTGFMKPPSLPQHLGPADVCSPPFSPPKSTVLTAQRSVEAPGLSLSLTKNHTPEMEGVITSAMAEKMRREVARLSQETERLEKEVSRQKALREGERVEFAEAKERLKASWAVDRDDFARVKEQLKKKNAEHHVQNGRLSQSLKEAEASCRMLRELCLRSGVLVPPELMQTSSSTLVNSTSLQSALSTEMATVTTKAPEAASEAPPPSAPLPPLPPSASQITAPPAPAPPVAPVPISQEPAAAAAVPAVVTGLPVPAVAAVAAPPATSAAAATAMAAAVMQQLESVTTAVNSTADAGAPAGERAERSTEQNVTAATAAANAAAALGQLAAALAGQAPPEMPAVVPAAVPVVAVPVSAVPAVPEPAKAEAKPVADAGSSSSEAGSGEGVSASISTEANKD
ncbi:g364 [Coccomyxa elongata]